MTMVKISQILNPSILNASWVGFQGDSEYFDENGELQMGSWSFLGIYDDVPTNKESEEMGEDPENWIVDDEIDANLLYCDKWLFPVENSKGEVCAVQFHYTRSD